MSVFLTVVQLLWLATQRYEIKEVGSGIRTHILDGFTRRLLP